MNYHNKYLKYKNKYFFFKKNHIGGDVSEIKEKGLRMTSSLYSANIYDDDNSSQLCIDWSYNGIYFNYKNENWIIINKNEIINEFNKNNTSEMKLIFKNLGYYALNNLKDQSIDANKQLTKLKDIIDHIV